MERKRVGILVFNKVEVLDFCGPFEVLAAVRLDEARRREEPSPFDIVLVAEHDTAITANGGLRVIPDYALADCPPLDILIVPGGWGVRQEIGNKPLLAWIAERGKQVETLASVCTGAMLLGHAGLLEGRRATTHWTTLGWMRESFPHVTVEDQLRFVEDGTIVTSAGVSAGIDMALRLVARTYGEDIARATARHMEYHYLETNAR